MRINEIINESEEDFLDLQDKVWQTRWQPATKKVLVALFSQKYPGTELYFVKKDSTGTLFVTTDKNNLHNMEIMSYYSDPTGHFNASILGPMLEQDDEGTRYLGYGFEAISSGQFRGIVTPFLQTVVPPMAKKFNANPAIIIAVEDQSEGAWQAIAQKLGWKYFNPDMG